MSKVKTLISLVKNNPKHIKVALLSNFCHLMISRLVPDKLFLKLLYNPYFNRKLDLKNPKTFNEKLQWLKLYNRNPDYCQLVDKYEVKEYISQIIGDEYIIPTLGIYDSFDKINFDELPNQFVLKCTHDSGSVVICTDKSNFDIEKAKAKLNKNLKANLFWHGREWPYKNVKPRIIAEKYMEDVKTAELRDYKFFCFDGAVKMMFIATDRQKANEEVKFDFFDAEFNWLDMKQGHENAAIHPEKPLCFDKMKELSAKLSKGLPHVRIDFYEVNGKIYFGEFTFFHFCGIVPFKPDEWDYKIGEWIDLPKKRK